MRVGVIGCGAVAHYCHVPALLRIRGVTIAAVADPDEACRNRAAKAIGCAAFKSAEFLLADSDVDAVIIATPPHTHASIGTMAARAGKSMYLEKPIATSLQDAVNLGKAVLEERVKAVVGFNRRFHPLYKRARSMLRRAAIGELRAVQTIFCEPVPVGGMPVWKAARSSGGGAPLDLASHHVDIARWLSDAEVSSISAQFRSDDSEHDSASMEMTLTTGVSVQSFVSFRAGYAERIVLIGDKGTIELDRHRASLSLQTARRWGYGARRRLLPPSASDLPWRIRRIISPAHDPSYHRALSAFAGGSDQLASLRDGEMSLRVILAAEESARHGGPVEVIIP
jgi:scyllo-inositol 2-dehydrogenase (NAD+)